MAEQTHNELFAWAHAMTLQTLSNYVKGLSEEIRSVSKAEREALLGEAGARLLFMDFLLNGQPAAALFGEFSEQQLLGMIHGGPVGDFTDLEETMGETMRELQQRMRDDERGDA